MNVRFHNPTASAALSLVAVVTCAATAAAQPTFSIDFQGPPKGFPDSCWGIPITEGDILIAVTGTPAPGPLPPPCVFISGGFGPPAPGLGLPMWPGALGRPPGVPGFVEVDALSYGMDLAIDPRTPPLEVRWYFSVDEWAAGIPGTPLPPAVWTEGPWFGGPAEASADVFADIGIPFPGPCMPPIPGGNTVYVDGDGIPPAIPFGLGLVEPNPPAPGPIDIGTNIDALDVDTWPAPVGVPPPPRPVFYSLDSAIVFDFLDGFPGTGSAMANGGFVGGDVLFSPGPGAPPILWAPAFMLGLDLFGPDTDDLDALAYWENGDGVYTPPQEPYSWVGGMTDMLLFSVRRGSLVIGMPDFLCGIPIEEGDVLLPPPAPGLPPGVWIPAEVLGLATVRSGTAPPGQPGDDLDALDVAADCNMNWTPDLLDIVSGTSADCNQNGVPDECDCWGDLDNDRDIDLADLAILLANYGAGGVTYWQGDLDCDGDVDLADLATLLAAYGTTC